MSSGSSAAQLNTSLPSLVSSKSSMLSLKNKKLVALVVGLLVVLGLVYYFVVRPRMSEGYKDTTDSNSKPKLILYWASWCGHSNAFMETWNAFEKKVKNEGVAIEMEKVQCDDSTKCIPGTDGVPDGLKGYPTVFLKTVDGVEEFTGDRTSDGLNTFITGKV
jgi:thiol-disulfide isomerase/thioredoxin